LILQPYYQQLQQLVAQQPDATLAEYCELMGESTGVWLSQSAMCRTLQRLNLPRKKTLRAAQGATERVQRLRVEYWQQVTQIAPENLVFLDEMGVQLGIQAPLD
jgi:hypothetical protein